MDFAYILCTLVSSLFLQTGFGQEPGAVDSPSTSFQLKISPELQEQQYQQGSNRVLSCQSSTTDSGEKPVLHWEFNDVKITATGKSERIRTETIDANTLWLRIENVRSGDGGTYRCVGTLGTQTDSRSVRIEVYETIVIKSPKEQFGIYGQHGVLTCEASAHPIPSYTWKYGNGSNIVDNDRIVVMPNQLTIKNLTFEDNGVYLCDLTVIQTGDSQMLTINFEVVKLPVIEEEPLVKPSVPKVGDTVTISCQAVGVPEPTYQFKKGDTLISENQVDSAEGIMTITDLKQSDEGSYVCVASNKGGSEERAVFLDVKIPPTIRDMPTETEAKEGDEKQITCVADGDPAPTVTWEKDSDEDDEDASPEDDLPQTEHVEGDENSTGNKTVSKTLNFVSVRPSQGGTYTCTAVSGVGVKYAKVTLNVKYAPKFNTNYKETTFYGWRGHTANMTCQVSANEVATIKWYKSSDSESGASEEQIETGNAYILNNLQTWPQFHLSSSSLLVQDADDDSNVFGEYQCEAQNSLGTERRTVRLVKAVGPEGPTVRVTNVRPTMVSLEIDVPENDGGQPVTGYFYSFFPLNDTTGGEDRHMDLYVEADEGTTTRVDLQNLLAKTSYVLQIRAKNSVDQGDQTTEYFETTDVSKPQQLNMTSAREGSEPTSYKVTWSEPYNGGSVITQYTIRYKKVAVVDTKAPQWQAESDLGKTFLEKIVTDPSARSYTIENLERNSFYDVRITARNKEGESVEEAKIIKTAAGGGSQAGQTVDGGEGSEEDKKAVDNDKDSFNVGVEDNEKKDEDDDEITVDTLGQRSDTQSAASASLGSGAIAGIIIGVFIAVLIIVVVLFLVFTRKPELVGRLRGLGGKGGEEERGKSDDGKDPAEEEKLIKKEDAVKVENETEESKPEQAVEEPQEEFEPDSKPEVQPTPDAGAQNGVGDKSPELSTPAATTEIKITPETPEKPENPPA